MKMEDTISTSRTTTTKNIKYNTLSHRIKTLIKTKKQALRKAKQTLTIAKDKPNILKFKTSYTEIQWSKDNLLARNFIC